ncbi:MAG: SDR family NAD(P)-dependent oxidoreductase [Alphaproteobacteria bacterium]
MHKITDWKGKNVWIIGGSHGIGKALARALARLDANIAVSGRNEETLDALVSSLPHSELNKGNHLSIPLDIRFIEELRSAQEEIISEWARIDAVIVSAAIYHPMRADDMDIDQAKEIIEVNLIGALNAIHVTTDHFLKKQKGRLIIMSSIAGYRGMPNALTYGASKAALINLAENLYLDLEKHGISVHLVNPGFVKTRLTSKEDLRNKAIISPSEAAEKIIEGLGKGRFNIYFPKLHFIFYKALKMLPNRLYFWVARNFLQNRKSY